MIRPDPDRPHTYIVDVSAELLLELRDGWSPPLRVMIENDELVMKLEERASWEQTRWTLAMKTEARGTFDVELVVATSEPDVVAAIEKAAAQAGLTVNRIPSSRGDEATD